MNKIVHRIGPLLVVAVFMAAVWFLYRELKHYHYRDIRNAIGAIPTWRLLASLGLTIVNYVVLIGYDYLAMHAIRHPLSLGKISLASFTGFVTSYNFGALLGGTSVRYRLYSAWGLSAVEILQLVIMMAITFWVGAFALAGVVFIVRPFPIPDKLHVPFTSVYPLGFVLLAISLGYVALAAFHRRTLHIRDRQFPLPGARMTLLQLSVAALDLCVAAGCLYVLVAHDITVGYWEFLGMYLLAVVVVLITHVPGGLGVFELILLTLSAPGSAPSMVAALLMFRIIYYLLPLMAAVLLLAGHEISLQRAAAERVWAAIGRWSEPIVASLLSWATLIAGMVLLVTIVCVAVGTAVMLAIVKQALLSRREADLEQYRAQTLWLAESGMDRASARLAADPGYRGEEWLLPAGDLGGSDAGRVSIRVEPIADEPDVFQVRVVADYPVDAVERARKSKEFRVRPRG